MTVLGSLSLTNAQEAPARKALTIEEIRKNRPWIPETTTLDSRGYLKDKVDYPFVPDPDVVGHWEVVDFVKEKSQFVPSKKGKFERQINLRGMWFVKDGTVGLKKRDHVWYPSRATWTKGFYQDRFVFIASKYEIMKSDGKTYLFCQKKLPGYTTRYEKPGYFVLQKVDGAAETPPWRSRTLEEIRKGRPWIPETTTLDKNGHLKDKMDYPFVPDPDVLGTWEVVDFVKEKKHFVPGKQSFRGPLDFLKGMKFDKNGVVSVKVRDSGWRKRPGKWTKGIVEASEYEIMKTDGEMYLFVQWKVGDYKIRYQKPPYYVLKKRNTKEAGAVDKTPKPATTEKQTFRSVRPVMSVKGFADARWKDLSGLDLSNRPSLPATLTFNEKTVWPNLLRMPEECHPRKIMTDAMNPGLGVRELHKLGITGKGVNVAIIDQPLYQNHPEFAGKIATYHDVGCGSRSSMHGPAVASLLVGTHCGTAPEARLYYVAAPSWTRDAAYQAKALDKILEWNKQLPKDNKIRVVSVSAAPSGPGSPFTKNNELWDVACDRAEAAGILVLDCTAHRGFVGSCYYDVAEPESVAKCQPGFPGIAGRSSSKKLLVPSSPRTTAEQYDKEEFSYQYCGRGGLSWSIPYCTGVLAMGWQLRPDLTASQMRASLSLSAFANAEGVKIIDPIQFISKVTSSPRE
ncbi:MAG: hypothetical protein JW818_12540 [Pirellulales bacterium]|nr:hypothetical protein [Pirellulales bacterium]